jgi:DNA-binding MurR/RpiR family transcriptional regulator
MAGPSGVRKAIEAHYTDLSAQQRQAADYLLAHQRTCFALSVKQLARAARVSEATLVRFARQVGYRGYHELRAALMREAQDDLSPEARFASTPAGTPASTLRRVLAQDESNLRNTARYLAPETFAAAVTALHRAPAIATLGLGVSSILARLAAYELFQIGRRAEVLLRDTLTLVEQIDRLSERTAVLSFSLPPYSKQTLAAAERARARKLPLLAVTDGVRAPISAHADLVLHVHSDNLLYTNSVTAAVGVTNALVTELALRDRGRALARLRAVNRASRDEYV